ncbi:MAG: hypothetical protein V5B44_05390 [Candidatus Accumulibacter necessarius]
MIRETYKWIVAPMQEARPGKGLSEIQWEHFPVNPGTQNLSQEIERVLKENELLITEWAPIHLATVLKTGSGKTTSRRQRAQRVAAECQQLYLPRFATTRSFNTHWPPAPRAGTSFGFAQGKEDGRYVGFTFGKRTSLFLDSSLLLIEPVTAAGYAEAQRAAEDAARPKPADHVPGTTATAAPRRASRTRPSRPMPQAVVLRHRLQRSSSTAASSSMPSKRKSNSPTSSMKSSCNSPRAPA